MVISGSKTYFCSVFVTTGAPASTLSLLAETQETLLAGAWCRDKAFNCTVQIVSLVNHIAVINKLGWTEFGDVES